MLLQMMFGVRGRPVRIAALVGFSHSGEREMDAGILLAAVMFVCSPRVVSEGALKITEVAAEQVRVEWKDITATAAKAAFDSTFQDVIVRRSRKEDVKLTSGDRVVYARKIKLSLKTGSQRVEGLLYYGCVPRLESLDKLSHGPNLID